MKKTQVETNKKHWETLVLAKEMMSKMKAEAEKMQYDIVHGKYNSA